MATINTRYILSTKKDEILFHLCVGKYVNKNNIFYIYRVPEEIYKRIPQKCFGGTSSIQEIIKTLELLGEYENGPRLSTKSSK